tara:strand:+ start:389 stop:559 length:171 start_codon:yes stop_codon:yes gene_type:complete
MRPTIAAAPTGGGGVVVTVVVDRGASNTTSAEGHVVVRVPCPADAKLTGSKASNRV